jgi:hypothetical protein
MSGDLISTEVLIDKRDIFEKGYGNFSSKSINELFDVNGDGVVSGEEMATMKSVGVLNTLDSISPVVARAFSDENFRLQTGAYLTDSQNMARNKFLLAINKAILVESMANIPEKMEPEELNIEPEELDTNDLMEDIRHRQYLSQGEIDNNV